MLTQSEINHLVQQVVAQMQPQAILIFGSYAKGTATLKSDLDLLVIKDTALPMGHRAQELAPLFVSLLVNVDVHVYTPEEIEEYSKEPFSFMQSILKSGHIAFKKAAF